MQIIKKSAATQNAPMRVLLSGAVAELVSEIHDGTGATPAEIVAALVRAAKSAGLTIELSTATVCLADDSAAPAIPPTDTTEEKPAGAELSREEQRAENVRKARERAALKAKQK